MAENNSNEPGNNSTNRSTTGTSDAQRGWLERQLEKIVGAQENMQPIIRACLSIAGFIGGFVAGYFVFGREKDKKLQEQELQIKELKLEIREQEKELKGSVKELEENRAALLRLETEHKLLKEGKKEEATNRDLNGFLPVRAAAHSYLD